MALRRYVFVYDASDSMAWVRRYLAIQNRDVLLSYTTDRPENYTSSQMREWDAIRAAWNRVWNEASSTDYFAATKWAFADAVALESDSSGAAVPAQMRAFIAAPRAPNTTSTFMHYANVDLASAYISRARTLSPSFINGLESREAQIRAVYDLWRNVASFFRALNIRPWSWAKYRSRLETQFGCYYNPSGTHIAIGERITSTPYESINPPNDAFGGLPRDMFLVRPTQLAVRSGMCTPGACPGAMRREAYARYLAIKGHDNTQGSAASVRFGTRSQIADGARTQSGRVFSNACLDIGSEVGPTACAGPTGELHPLWITDAALLGGGLNYPADPVEEGWADDYDCISRSLVDGTVRGPDKARGYPGYNWNCAALTGPYTGLSQIARLQRVWEQPWISYLPPMLWYELLLWPLVVELSAIDPMRLIYECQIDVLGKNLWTAIACGRNVSDIGSQGILEGVATIAKIRQYLGPFSLGVGAGAGVAGLVNPIAGAVVALVGGLVTVMEQATEHDPRYKLDCFGRVEPCVDMLAIDAAGRTADAPSVERMISAGAPPIAGVDGYEAPAAVATNHTVTITGQGTPVGKSRGSFSWISDPSSYAARAGGREQSLSESTQKFAEPDEAIVRIVGMPHGGGVYVDGATTPIDGQWEAGTDATVWVVPVPYGTHYLTVRSPDGQARSARVSLNSGQTLTGEFATMQPVVPEPPRQNGMSGAAKAGVAVLAIGAIGGGAYAFRKKLGLESFFRSLTGKR